MSRLRPLARGILGIALGLFFAAPVFAQDWADALAMEPPVLPLANYDLSLTGFAYGAGYTASHPGGPLNQRGYDDSNAVGQIQTQLRLQRIYDSGLIVGAWTSFLLVHDDLSGDNYGNDTIQRAYLYLQTGLGRLEVGQQDGAAYQIGVTAPTVDDHISLENPDSALFRAPSGDAIQSYAQEVTVLNSSSNAAKFTYITPRLFGAQIGLSYTPDLVKSPLPFLGNPSNGPDQQASLWEGVASYNTFVSDTAVGVSVAFAHGALRNPTSLGGDLYDWSLGLQFAQTFGGMRLSGGVAYRISNGFGFSPQVIEGVDTNRMHAGVLVEFGAFSVGAEYSQTERNFLPGAGTVRFDAYQLGVSYRPNDNLYVSAGWQFYNYKQDVDIFYHGLTRLDVNAGFLTIGYQVQ